MGCKDAVDTINTALEVFTDPFRTTAQTIIEFCAYAATGDVLLIQELLHVIGERGDETTSTTTTSSSSSKSTTSSKSKDSKSKAEWDFSVPQAVAGLAVAIISLGDEVGMEMMQRILGNIWRYGDIGKTKVVSVLTFKVVVYKTIGLRHMITKVTGIYCFVSTYLVSYTCFTFY